MLFDKWDRRWMYMANTVAAWSKDPSTKVGAVIADGKRLVSFGYNGPASGTDDDKAFESRDEKLRRALHAELNAILEAKGSCKDAVIYVTRHPCAQCAAAIIQAGISTVIYPAGGDAAFVGRWADDIQSAREQFLEAGVLVWEYPGEITNG